jgi:hypothetical protein
MFGIIDQSKHGAEKNPRENSRYQKALDEIRNPQSYRHGAESISLLNHKYTVETEGDIQNAAQQGENAKKNQAGQDEMEMPGEYYADQQRQESA